MAEKTFEQLYAALEEKARQLEQGNLPLEQSLKLYEEGAKLADELRAILEKAELTVREVQSRLQLDSSRLGDVEAEYDYVDGDEE